MVTLTAVADANSTFDGWSGDTDCSDGSVTLSSARNCIATFTAIPPQPKMIAHYSFDNNHDDSSGNNNDGLVSGATYDATIKKIGSHAISFDGVNDYSTGATASNLNNLIADKISISTWVRKSASQTGWSAFIQRTKSNSYYEYFLL